MNSIAKHDLYDIFGNYRKSEADNLLDVYDDFVLENAVNAYKKKKNSGTLNKTDDRGHSVNFLLAIIKSEIEKYDKAIDANEQQTTEEIRKVQKWISLENERIQERSEKCLYIYKRLTEEQQKQIINSFVADLMSCSMTRFCWNATRRSHAGNIVECLKDVIPRYIGTFPAENDGKEIRKWAYHAGDIVKFDSLVYFEQRLDEQLRIRGI